MPKRMNRRVREVIDAFGDVGREGIPSDVLGSYTGCAEKGERPIQDADDL